MDANDATNRLKAIQDSHLGESAGELDPDRILSEAFPEVIRKESALDRSAREHILSALDRLVKEAKYSKRAQTILENAWRCTYTFAHQNHRMCNAVNGTYKKQLTIRKTCQQCGQFRRNPRTIREEVTELVIAEAIERGMSREDALARLANHNDGEPQIRLKSLLDF